MSMIDELKEIFLMKDIKENPLVCFITNHVTELDLVDACLAVGGSPVLIDEISESHEIISYAGVNALMINTGTINREYLDIMIETAREANKNKVPVIFDPAAIGASSFRKDAVKRLFQEVSLDIIKGNLGEIKSMLGYKAKTKGIDSFEEEKDVEKYALELANLRKAVVVVTGKTDVITDGRRIVRINNGSPRLRLVCGAGSTIGSIIAVFAAYSKDNFLSAVLGTLLMGVAGELAERRLKSGEGTRTFKQYVHDAISLITWEQIVAMARIEEASEEYFDIFDENMEPLGVAPRGEAHRKGLWHKAFQCWFIRREGAKTYILFQKRSPHKDTYPDLFDTSSAGHLLSGETIKDGVRELYEEVGIKTDFSELIYLGTVKQKKKEKEYKDFQFGYLYLYECNKPLMEYSIQREEITALVEMELGMYKALIDGTIKEVEVKGIAPDSLGNNNPVSYIITFDNLVPHGKYYYELVYDGIMNYLG
ncbi:MAG: hydroxyethylthiazole kinase [Clostridiaceae bacterium]